MENLSIPNMNINVLSIPHVQKVSIPRTEKRLYLYEIYTFCLDVV